MGRRGIGKGIVAIVTASSMVQGPGLAILDVEGAKGTSKIFGDKDQVLELGKKSCWRFVNVW